MRRSIWSKEKSFSLGVVERGLILGGERGMSVVGRGVEGRKYGIKALDTERSRCNESDRVF